jgi:outer membrane biosynthesis protein TonB
LSLDRAGQVAEILPLSLLSERADGSARRQIMKWKFKPAMQDGVPVQAEGILNFEFNTRSFGPAEPLTDAQARKLASNIVEPVFPAGVASGATFSFSVAVDEAGNVIEVIAGDGPHELFTPCFAAIGKWRFNPIVEDGKPLPYRAQVTFRVP